MAERKIRVLVVDDDPDHLLLAELSLRASGFDVHTHATAFGVSNLVRSLFPDVVLLDVNIPALSGDRLLALARAQAPRQTRFVLYSGTDEARLRALSLAAGADGYISKEIRGLELGKRLLEIYRKAESEAGPTLPGNGSPPLHPTPGKP